MIERVQIGPAVRHASGARITVHEMTPDVLLRVDGHDHGFYLSAAAARAAGVRYADEAERQAQEAAAKAAERRP